MYCDLKIQQYYLKPQISVYSFYNKAFLNSVTDVSSCSRQFCSLRLKLNIHFYYRWIFLNWLIYILVCKMSNNCETSTIQGPESPGFQMSLNRCFHIASFVRPTVQNPKTLPTLSELTRTSRKSHLRSWNQTMFDVFAWSCLLMLQKHILCLDWWQFGD